MKKQRLLLSLGALVCALFLSGCMAAMVPAMILGHASHGQRGPAHGSTHGPAAETCACAAAADDSTATTPVPPPVNHEHRP